MTSPRFPIGVAQTRSGIYRSPSSASKPDERSADEPGVVAERRLDDPELLVGGVERLAAGRDQRRPGQELPGSRPEAAADDDDLRREDVREGSDREPEVVADAGQGRARRLVSVERFAHEAVPVGPLAPELDGDALRRLSGGDRLEVPVAVAVPLARRAVRHDNDVAELGPAAVEATVQDHASADARAERERNEIGRALPRSYTPLGERDRVPVVLDPHRHARSGSAGARRGRASEAGG